MSDDRPPLAPPYDWKISLRKGVFAAFKTLGGIAVYAVLQWMASDQNVSDLLKDFPALLAVAPGIAGIAAYLLNAMKHREN